MPEHPNVEKLITLPAVKQALDTAWRNSFGGLWMLGSTQERTQCIIRVLKDPDEQVITMHERGGWIYQNRETEEVRCVQAPAGASHSIDLDISAPHLSNDWYVIANFHTHPNLPRAEPLGNLNVGLPFPSRADLDNASIRRVPGIVVTWPLRGTDYWIGDEIASAELRERNRNVPDSGAYVLEKSGLNQASGTGTLYAYGPERRAGWCDPKDNRNYPKQPLGGQQIGFSGLSAMNLKAVDYPLDRKIELRIMKYIGLYRYPHKYFVNHISKIEENDPETHGKYLEATEMGLSLTKMLDYGMI